MTTPDGAPAPGRTIRTAENTTAFLDALAATASVRAACEFARIDRASVYRWRDEDPRFAEEWNAALDRGTDALEDEAVRRAREGWEKPIYRGNELVGSVREYSDALLALVLRARRPEKYRERPVIEVDDAGELTSNERRARIAELLAKQC
jgi:hypothetical protein